MTNHSELRKRLESTSYPDLGAMMEGYARAAVELAKRDFGHKLEYTSDSIDELDEILVQVGESPELDLDFEVRLWGAYLGEVLRKRYAAGWEMTPYPGGAVAVPAVDVRGSRLFPAHEGVPPPHHGRRGRPSRLLQHGHRAAGEARPGELETVVSRQLSVVTCAIQGKLQKITYAGIHRS
jgi:hypothetical protein